MFGLTQSILMLLTGWLTVSFPLTCVHMAIVGHEFLMQTFTLQQADTLGFQGRETIYQGLLE